jgi:hypothetical protein
MQKTSLTGAYQNSLCSVSDASVDSTNYSNGCPLSKLRLATQEPFCLIGDSSWTLPAGNDVNMTSEVTFKNAAGTTKTEQIGANPDDTRVRD